MDSHNPNDPIIPSASLFADIFLNQQVNFVGYICSEIFLNLFVVRWWFGPDAHLPGSGGPSWLRLL